MRNPPSTISRPPPSNVAHWARIKINRLNSHPIIHCPLSERVRKVVKRTSEWTREWPSSYIWVFDWSGPLCVEGDTSGRHPLKRRLKVLFEIGFSRFPFSVPSSFFGPEKCRTISTLLKESGARGNGWSYTLWSISQGCQETWTDWAHVIMNCSQKYPLLSV